MKPDLPTFKPQQELVGLKGPGRPADVFARDLRAIYWQEIREMNEDFTRLGDEGPINNYFGFAQCYEQIARVLGAMHDEYPEAEMFVINRYDCNRNSCGGTVTAK